MSGLPIDDAWYPVARGVDLAPRHVFHGELFGVELALWRSDGGEVNAWENRCPHRGVRLTLGANNGAQLRCQYHGWRYRSGGGQCVAIPAASQSPPPASLCARTFAVIEQGGYVWVNLRRTRGTTRADTASLTQDWANEADAASVTWPSAGDPLRGKVMRAPVDTVAQALANAAPDGSAPVHRTHRAMVLAWPEVGQIVFRLQPANAGKTIVHAALQAPVSPAPSMLRRLDDALNRLRRRVEARVPVGTIRIVSHTEAMQGLPGPALQPGRIAARVARRESVAEDIVAFELQLPDTVAFDYEAGAHIDVHTPGGVVRQYSIVDAPGERPGRVVIGVKREPASRGGSRSLHEQAAVDQTLWISPPKNHFRLNPGRGGLLVAGGIGITPLLAMARQLQRQGLPCVLHYFVRGEAHVAFADRLRAIDAHALHVGLSPEQTRQAIDALMADLDESSDVYVCGPQPLLDTVRASAAAAGVAAARVRFELFAQTLSHADDRAFRVRLAHSGAELAVPADRSLADVLREHGCAVETSCEQGVCGTCIVGVLDGDPEHRDVYLSDAEKAARQCMTPCVSRSRSACLVLDL